MVCIDPLTGSLVGGLLGIERNQSIGVALLKCAFLARRGIVPQHPRNQVLQGDINSLAGDAIQLGVDHNHVVVAFEHLGKAAGSKLEN